jgi:hypothetical protein
MWTFLRRKSFSRSRSGFVSGTIERRRMIERMLNVSSGSPRYLIRSRRVQDADDVVEIPLADRDARVAALGDLRLHASSVLFTSSAKISGRGVMIWPTCVL